MRDDAPLVLGPDPRDTMRDMTEAELDAWASAKRWPCCGEAAMVYRPGPRAGIMQNVACVHCDMRINVPDPAGPYTVIRLGQVIREPRPR